MTGKNQEDSRGKPTVAELYNLESDIGERQDVAAKHPEIVERMTAGLKSTIDRGANSTGERAGANDRLVQFDQDSNETVGGVVMVG